MIVLNALDLFCKVACIRTEKKVISSFIICKSKSTAIFFQLLVIPVGQSGSSMIAGNELVAKLSLLAVERNLKGWH